MLIVLVLQSIGFNKYIFIIINRYTNVLYKLQTMASGLAANTTIIFFFFFFFFNQQFIVLATWPQDCKHRLYPT